MPLQRSDQPRRLQPRRQHGPGLTPNEHYGVEPQLRLQRCVRGDQHLLQQRAAAATLTRRSLRRRAAAITMPGHLRPRLDARNSRPGSARDFMDAPTQFGSAAIILYARSRRCTPTSAIRISDGERQPLLQRCARCERLAGLDVPVALRRLRLDHRIPG